MLNFISLGIDIDFVKFGLLISKRAVYSLHKSSHTNVSIILTQICLAQNLRTNQSAGCYKRNEKGRG